MKNITRNLQRVYLERPAAMRLIGMVVALLALGVYPAAWAGECVRTQAKPSAPGVQPDFDGPGSFGKLQDTVTLGCLKYAGSIGKGNAEQVLIRDDTGKIHRLRVGDYMGENTGVITAIDRDYIHIRQQVPRDGETVEVIVKFPKVQGASTIPDKLQK